LCLEEQADPGSIKRGLAIGVGAMPLDQPVRGSPDVEVGDYRHWYGDRRSRDPSGKGGSNQILIRSVFGSRAFRGRLSMVQIIEDEAKAGTCERIEFYVWRSATGNVRGRWQHCKEEADRNASIMSSRPFTPIGEEFRRGIAWAEESEVPFVWVNDPHRLFPPSTRDLCIPTKQLRPKPGSRNKDAVPG
jgi:hypothetical protein